MHAWSMQGRLSILLQVSLRPLHTMHMSLLIRCAAWQAPGIWDKDVLQDYMNATVRQISFIMME